MAHTVDANTVALWRFNETSHADASANVTLDETANSYDFTAPFATARPIIVGDGTGNEGANARYSPGSQATTMFMQGTPDATLRAAMQSDWTFECWVYLKGYQASERVIYAHHGTAGSEAAEDNYQLQVSHTNTGAPRVFWETGAGVNVGINGSTAIPLNQWVHLAITGSESGGTTTVAFYLDDVAAGSGSGATATGGTGVSQGLAILANKDGNSGIWGAISQLRICDAVKSSAEITANATDPDHEFPNDADTIMLLKFDDTPEISDVSGNGYHLAPVDWTQPPRITQPLITDGGRARFGWTNNAGFRCAPMEAIRQVFLGEYTVEWWSQMQPASFQGYGVMEWGDAGENEATNFVMQIRTVTATGNEYRGQMFWEYGAGINVTHLMTTAWYDNDEEGVSGTTDATHMALVVEDEGGGLRSVSFYRNGVLVQKVDVAGNAPSGGTDAPYFLVCQSSGLDINGWVDDMRISDKVRTPAELLASYEAGRRDTGTGGGGDTTPPTVTFNTPAGNLGVTDPISIDVTDNLDELGVVVISAIYASGLVTTVYDNSAFVGSYATGATATPITDGTRYVFRQSAEWWEDVTIKVVCTDEDGNVTTSSRAYLVPDGGGAPGVPGDGAPPSIQNVTPAAGSPVLPETVVGFDIIDGDADLYDVVVMAIFESRGIYEVIWDGDNFSPRYLGGSTRTTIANGFRYTLKRAGNWPEKPKIRIRAFDANRNAL